MDKQKACLLDEDELAQRSEEYAYYKEYLKTLPGSQQLLQSSSHRYHQLELIYNSSRDEGDKVKGFFRRLTEGKLTPRRRRRRKLLEALHLRKGAKSDRQSCCISAKSSTENDSVTDQSSSSGTKQKCTIRKIALRSIKKPKVKPLQNPEIKVEDWSEVKTGSSEAKPARISIEKGVHCSVERPLCKCVMCKFQEKCSIRFLCIFVTLALITTLGFAMFLYFKTNFESADISDDRRRIYGTTSYIEELPFYGANIPFRTESVSLLGLEDEQERPQVKVEDAGTDRYVDEGRGRDNIGKYHGEIGLQNAEEGEMPNRRRIRVNVWRYRNDRDTDRWNEEYKQDGKRNPRKYYHPKRQHFSNPYNDRLRYLQKTHYDYDIVRGIPEIERYNEYDERKQDVKNYGRRRKNFHGHPKIMGNVKHLYKNIYDEKKMLTRDHLDLNNMKNKMGRKLDLIENENDNSNHNIMSNDLRIKNPKLNNDTFPYKFLTDLNTLRPQAKNYVVHIHDSENVADHKICVCDLKNRFNNYRRHRKPLMHKLFEKVFGHCYPVCCQNRTCCETENVKLAALDHSAKKVSKKCPCNAEYYNLICFTKNATSKSDKRFEYPAEYSYKKPFPFSNSSMVPVSKIHGDNFYDSFKSQSEDKINQANERSSSEKMTNYFSTKDESAGKDGLKHITRENQRFNQNLYLGEQFYELKPFRSTNKQMTSTLQPRVTIKSTLNQDQLYGNNRKLLSYNADEYASNHQENEDESDIVYDDNNIDNDKVITRNRILKDNAKKEEEMTEDEAIEARSMDKNFVGTGKVRLSKQYRADDKYKEEASDISRWRSSRRGSEIDNVKYNKVSSDTFHNGNKMLDGYKNNDKANVGNGILSIKNRKIDDQDEVNAENGVSYEEYDSKGETSDSEQLRVDNDSSQIYNKKEVDVSEEDEKIFKNRLDKMESKSRNKTSGEHKIVSKNKVIEDNKYNRAERSQRGKIISRDKRPYTHKANLNSQIKKSMDNVDDEVVGGDQNYKTDMRSDYYKHAKSVSENEKNDNSESSKRRRFSVNEKLSGIVLSHDGDTGRISREGIRIFCRRNKLDNSKYNGEYQSNSGPDIKVHEFSKQHEKGDRKYDVDHQGDTPSNNDRSKEAYNRHAKQSYGTGEKEPVYIRNRKRYNLKKLSNDYWNKQSGMQKFKTIDVRNDLDEKDDARLKFSSFEILNENEHPRGEENGSTDEENVQDKVNETQKILESIKKCDSSSENDTDVDFDQITIKPSDETSTQSKIHPFDHDVNLNAQDYSDYGVLHDTRLKAASDGTRSDAQHAAVMSVVVHKSYGTIDVNGVKRMRAREEHITYLPNDKKLLIGERNPKKLLATLQKLQPIANKTILYDRLIPNSEPQSRKTKRYATNSTYSYNDICKKIIEYKIQQNMANKRQKTNPNNGKEDNFYIADLNGNDVEEGDEILDPDMMFKVRSLLSVNLDVEESDMTTKSFTHLNSTITLNTTNYDKSNKFSTGIPTLEKNSTSNQKPLTYPDSTKLNLNKSDSQKSETTTEHNDKLKTSAENLTSTVTISSATVNHIKQNITDSVDLYNVVKRNVHWDWGQKRSSAITKKINSKAARDYAKFIRLKLKMQRFNQAKSAESMFDTRNFRSGIPKKRRMRRRYGRKSYVRRHRFKRPVRMKKRNALFNFNLAGNNFERASFMKRPFYRETTSTPTSSYSGDDVIREAFTGERSARIVDQILQEARNDHFLNTMFGENQRVAIAEIPTLAEYVGAMYVEDRNKATKIECNTSNAAMAAHAKVSTPCSCCIKPSHVLGDIEEKLLQLIEEQVYVRTCLKLPPELQTFLRELTCDKGLFKKSGRFDTHNIRLPKFKHVVTKSHNLTKPDGMLTAQVNRS